MIESKLLINLVIGIFFIFGTSNSLFATEHSDGSYRPEPDFLIKDADFRETLIFISGFTYGLKITLASSEAVSEKSWNCIDLGLINHSHVIDIANAKLDGVVTAEDFVLRVVDALILESKKCEIK